MLNKDLKGEKSELGGCEELTEGDLESGIRREPSFSVWCDENGIPYSGELESKHASVDDFDFELRLQQITIDKGFIDKKKQDFSEGQPIMEIGGDIKEHHRRNLGNESNKYEAFDIENGFKDDQNCSNAENCDAKCINNHGISQKKAKLFSAADVLKTLFFVLVWYTFSTFLTLYNKTLLGDELGKFPAPLLMNTFHFAMQAVFSRAVTFFCSQRFQPPVLMSWRDFFVRVVPTALSTAMDINLSNESLVFISVTFATMCKSAAPIFLLLFAFAFRLESPSCKLLGIISVISVGVLLTVSKETEFDFWGFVFVMLAAVMSGFRWTMTQILLQKEAYGLKNPLTFMSYVTPVMAVATALLSIILDPWHEFKNSNYFDSSWHIFRSCLLMAFGGTLAFFMVLTEYILLSVTSAVTVTIAGVVKEAVTILVAVFYFHDKFTWLKGAGLVIILIGVSLFNLYKYQKLHQGETTEHEEELSSSTGNASAKYVILEEMDDDEEDDAPES